MPESIEYAKLGGEEAVRLLDEISRVYRVGFSLPPHEFGEEEVAVFNERFPRFAGSPGFSLITARYGGGLVGFGHGFTLPETTGWWSELLAPAPEDVTREYPGRTFALIDMAVLPAWRRQGIATQIHDRILADRPEERATLTVRVQAVPARAAYAKWGWLAVAQKRNPMPRNPLVDVMMKALR